MSLSKLKDLINKVKLPEWRNYWDAMRHFDWNSRESRRTVATIIVLVSVFVILPALFVKQSFNAVINARFVVVYSPIEGHIEGFDKEAGDPVLAGETLLAVNNIVKNQSFKQQQAELELLRNELADKVSLNTGFEARRIDWQIVETQNELDGEKNVLKLTKERLKDLEPLYREKLVTRYRYDEDQQAVKRTEAKIGMLQARLDRLMLEKQALYQGIRMGEGRNDVPYTRQRMDEVTMQLADVRAKIGLNGANGSYPVPAPISGFIWQKVQFNNSEVVIGTELAQLINCQDLFVDAEISESALADIEIGTAVKYRLLGDDDYREGRLVAKIGAGSTLEDKTLAATLPIEEGSARVMIKINPADLDPNIGNRCHIGRKVEVKLPRGWTPFSWLTRLFG